MLCKKTALILALFVIAWASVANADTVRLSCKSTTNPTSSLFCTFDFTNSIVINCFNPINHRKYSQSTPLHSTADYVEWNWSVKDQDINGTFRLRRQTLELVNSLAGSEILVSDQCSLFDDANHQVSLLPATRE